MKNQQMMLDLMYASINDYKDLKVKIKNIIHFYSGVALVTPKNISQFKHKIYL